MYLRFTKPVTVFGVAYESGDVVPATDVPRGSHRALIRGQQAEYVDAAAVLPPPAPVDPPTDHQTDHQTDPKPFVKKSSK